MMKLKIFIARHFRWIIYTKRYMKAWLDSLLPTKATYNSVHPREKSMLFREEYIPQITLDEVVDCINPKWIYLLNTDTEGNDLEVLRGASQTLKRTLLVCTEYHGDNERLELEEYMSENLFSPVFSNSLNIIFRNTKSFEDLM